MARDKRLRTDLEKIAAPMRSRSTDVPERKKKIKGNKKRYKRIKKDKTR